MRKNLRYGLWSFFLLLALLGGGSIYSIFQSQYNARLINYTGLVRGATQRLVKLELAHRPDNAIMDYVDSILHELHTEKGPYGLIHPNDPRYLEHLDRLIVLWKTLKEHIQAARKDPAAGDALLTASEDFFEQADKTVFAAEAYADRRTSLMLRLFVIMATCLLLTWVLIFWAYSKKMFLLEKQSKDLYDMTDRDSLTGAYNMERFKREAQELIQNDRKTRYAVAYVDFADFKYINDVFGYEYGNRVLQEYARITAAELDEKEIFGRVSADNFVILRHYNDKMEVLARQRAIDARLMDFLHNSRNKQSLPVCCGICCLEDAPGDLAIENFLDRANFARKTVKNGEQTNYAFYNENIRDSLLKEKSMVGQMREALRQREFVVYYQPKIDLQNGKIASAEALVRWRQPDGQIMPPDKFIPVFEKNNLITSLDQYVFETVCCSLRRRLDAGLPVVPVSVNVSRLQFYDPAFVENYATISQRYSIPHGLLELEFTESIVFNNLSLLTDIVLQLKQKGFSCSIDDFGKGYSSLGLLKSLPIDTLKIDKLFFCHSDDKEKEKENIILTGVITLLRKLRIRTVAEGIESQDQVDFLKSIKCDLVQGYVFYRPMPEEEYEAVLERESLTYLTNTSNKG